MANQHTPAGDRLVRAFSALDAQGRRSLLDFAEFLLERSSGADTDADASAAPCSFPAPAFEDRPEEETVSGAVTRLSRVYAMLDVDAIVSGATQTVLERGAMRGKTSAQLITELEALFAEHYRRARTLS